MAHHRYERSGASSPRRAAPTVECSFAIFKRGVYGTFHNIREAHPHRYLAEFDFRWNNRIALGVDNTARTNEALKGVGGKRLTYRRIGESANA